MKIHPPTGIALLVDKDGNTHGELALYEDDPQAAVDNMNEMVVVATDGKYHYILAAPKV